MKRRDLFKWGAGLGLLAAVPAIVLEKAEPPPVKPKGTWLTVERDGKTLYYPIYHE